MPDTQIDNVVGPVDLGFTTVTLKTLLDERAAMAAELLAERSRRYDERVAAEARLQTERDRRYAEVNVEKEKALKIKETADRDALQLARDIQTYKDQQHNGLLNQLNGERGLYATKDDLGAAIEKVEATIGPLLTYVAAQQGRGAGLNAGWGYLVGGVGLFLTLLLIGGALLAFAR
jgi:hypothetical protein